MLLPPSGIISKLPSINSQWFIREPCLSQQKKRGERSKQKKETETSESSDTLRREEQGSEIEHSVLASGHANSFSITVTSPKTAPKATVKAGGLIRAKKGDWRGTEIQMAQSFSNCTAAIHATKVHKGIILSLGGSNVRKIRKALCGLSSSLRSLSGIIARLHDSSEVLDGLKNCSSICVLGVNLRQHKTWRDLSQQWQHHAIADGTQSDLGLCLANVLFPLSAE